MSLLNFIGRSGTYLTCLVQVLMAFASLSEILFVFMWLYLLLTSCIELFRKHHYLLIDKYIVYSIGSILRERKRGGESQAIPFESWAAGSCDRLLLLEQFRYKIW